MKKTGSCPKCGSREIFTNDGTMLYNDRSYITSSFFGRMPLVTYICASCGYLEDYAKDTEGRHMSRVKAIWRRIGG